MTDASPAVHRTNTLAGLVERKGAAGLPIAVS
jgi:hypothetical protein